MDEPRTSGLLNLANNCYLNSVLQIFARILPLREYLNTHTHSVDAHRSSCVSCILHETFSKLWNGPSTPAFFPRDLLAWLKEKGNGQRFTEFEQSDPYELIELLLENIALNPFRHEEISRTSCVACLNEDVMFKASDLPGNGIRVNLNSSSATSVQQIIDKYKQSLADYVCCRCGEFKVTQREITTAPNVLMVSLERNQVINNKYMKDISPCEANHTVFVTLNNGVTAKYNILGTIDHIGASVSSGHYVAKVKGSQNVIVYSDSLMQSGNYSHGDVTLAFYLKENICINGSQERELLQTSGCNVERANKGLNIQSLENVTYIDPRVKINQKHLEAYVEAHATRDELNSLCKDRVLVIGLPKQDDMQEPGASFKERYESFILSKRDIIFTITHEQSPFLKKIQRDPGLQSMYDFFTKKIAEKLGSKNEHEWIAEIALCYIMHTHMHSEGPRYEFFFQLRERAIITRCIILYFENVKQRVIQKLSKLKDEPLFCVTSCQEDCFIKNDSYHFSISNMKALEKLADHHYLSRHHLWSFLDNEDHIHDHPLKDLLVTPEIKKDEDIVDALTRLLNTFQLNVTGKWFTYILLVVKNFDVVPTVQNLKEIWESRNATFGLYVGYTSQKRYRKDHLKTIEEGGRSAVSRFLDKASHVFLVTSLPFRKKTDALNAEARLIVSTLGCMKFEQRMATMNNKNLNYDVLNIKSEYVPLRQNTLENKLAYKHFMKSGQRLFRFIGEEVQPNWLTEGVLQSYLVKKQIK